MKYKYLYTIMLLCWVLLSVQSAAAENSSSVLINQVAMKEEQDWIEFIALQEININGWQVLEAGQTVLKTMPSIALRNGDKLVLHLNQSGLTDEGELTGAGSNGVWDVYSSDAGLTGTDNVLRLLDNNLNVIDSVIWSNGDGKFTSAADQAEILQQSGQWTSNNTPEYGWQDSDLIPAGSSLARKAAEDTNSAIDWEIATPFILGNVATTITQTPMPTDPAPTLPVVSTPTPTPFVIPTPTDSVTVTPTPTLENEPKSIIITDISNNSSVSAGQEFTIKGALKVDKEIDAIWIKLEATSDGSQWYAAQTKGNSSVFVSWNSPWNTHPQVSNVVAGEDTVFSIVGRIKAGLPAGEYKLRLKAKLGDSNSIILSEVVTLQILPTVITPSPKETTEVEGDDLTEGRDEEEELSVEVIRSVHMKDVGEEVHIQGVVTAANGLLGAKTIYMQDASGGIQVRFKDSDLEINLGDEVMVTGETRQSYGEKYVYVADTPTVLQNNATLPEVQIVTQLSEDLVGQLVSVDGSVTKLSGNTLWVRTNEGEIKIVVKESAGFKRPALKKGQVLTVSGIVGKYKQEFRLLPRQESDFNLSSSSTAKVLSARTGATRLPKTGIWVGLLGVLLIALGFFVRLALKRPRI